MKKKIYLLGVMMGLTASAAMAQNVGIGTTTPAAKLHVVGNVAIQDGTQGAGKVLTSDAAGIASWQAPAGAGASTATQTASYAVPIGNGAQPSAFFGVTEGSYTTVSNTTNVINFPSQKAAFINYVLGVDDVSAWTGYSPFNRFEIYIDGVASGIFIIIQTEVSGHFELTLSGVRTLSAGNHTFDVRATRWYNNGAPASAYQICGTISSNLDVTYLN
ncbi:hypothetical protein GCM10007423_64820 [Dyadobacter endophyticus]|uniref:Uncharacterized protein n=1 Tax=Dyadobacter endophyticus TaxID=1749036 RepID=A0ABQ1ZBR9_9BACT|nr:hypothetical protein [Dyadobacter endophyticus]GGH56349.1 hypothetical protein GCM10007423_64820 [Dyadobacter endophyticus]